MKYINQTQIKNCLYLMLAFSLLYTHTVSAQNEGRWYEVEVLIFKRLGSEAYTPETWPQNTTFQYPNDYKYLINGEEGDNFSLLPKTSHQLGGYNYTLRNDKNYEVLSHQAWRQQMQSQKDSPSIIISAGKDIGGHQELEGLIEIYISRYIHVVTDLWLTVDNKKNQIQRSPLPPKPGGSVQGIYSSNYPIATLRERRRMRSTELHYIDHPLMGMLILFTPID